MTRSASAPGQPAVAAAIVASNLGVLVGRRRDGDPSWTFPAGKIEAGESPEDAAVRETFEETGLRVRAAGIIGSRVHPVTGVRIVYVAAVLAQEPGIIVTAGELTEARWVSATEAGQLMGGTMYGPVQAYLRRRLGGP